MGEPDHTYQPQDRSQVSSREQAERSVHAAENSVSLGHGRIAKAERVLVTRAEAEAFAREHASQTTPAFPERQASSVDLQEFKRIKEQNRMLIEKNERLVAQNNELWAEIDRLQKENQELSEYVKKRKDQKAKAQARYRQKKGEEYNAYHKEYMEAYRARQKQEAEGDTQNPKRNMS